MDFVEICNVCTRKAIIKAAKRIFNSDKICRSYCDFYFGVTFFGTQCRCCWFWFFCVLLYVFLNQGTFVVGLDFDSDFCVSSLG